MTDAQIDALQREALHSCQTGGQRLCFAREGMRFSLPMPDGTFVPIESEPAAPAARWWSST